MKKALLGGLVAASSLLAEPAKEYTKLLPTLEDKLAVIKDAVVDEPINYEAEFATYPPKHEPTAAEFIRISYDSEKNILTYTARINDEFLGKMEDFNGDGFKVHGDVDKQDTFSAEIDSFKDADGTFSSIYGHTNIIDAPQNPPMMIHSMSKDYASLVDVCHKYVTDNKK